MLEDIFQLRIIGFRKIEDRLYKCCEKSQPFPSKNTFIIYLALPIRVAIFGTYLTHRAIILEVVESGVGQTGLGARLAVATRYG